MKKNMLDGKMNPHSHSHPLIRDEWDIMRSYHERDYQVRIFYYYSDQQSAQYNRMQNINSGGQQQ